MCFDYEFPELEKDLMKPIKQKKNIETEKLEESPLTVTAETYRFQYLFFKNPVLSSLLPERW